MNIDKTLAACRAELARQKDIEAKATPGPWEEVSIVDIWRKGPTVTDGNGYDAEVVCLSRNLNPARLKVAEAQLAITKECIKKRKMDYITEEPLRLAAALLGVEVVE